MSSIKLDNLGQSNVGQTVTYKDIHLDLEPDRISTSNLHSSTKALDVAVSTDEGAIKNSLVNLFSTMPGQKLLDPTYGLNINQFLFAPLHEDTAEEIGETIFNGISYYEPRVVVENVSVNINDMEQQFEILISLRIPTLSNSMVTFTGILGQTGFNIS